MAESGRDGVWAVARLLAAVFVLLLAVLAILMILDVVPRSAFAEMTTRIGLVGLIAFVTVLIVGVLVRKPGS
jgi:hypothetical protein